FTFLHSTPRPALHAALPILRMVEAQPPLAIPQPPPVEWLGFSVPLLTLIQIRQILHRVKRVRMVGAQHPLAIPQRLLVERLGFGDRKSTRLNYSHLVITYAV